jgi:hypothetical protein
MHKGKDFLMMVGILTALMSCFSGLAYGFMCSQQPRRPVTKSVEPVARHKSWTEFSGDRAAMEAARNEDTSNFDNVLRF